MHVTGYPVMVIIAEFHDHAAVSKVDLIRANNHSRSKETDISTAQRSADQSILDNECGLITCRDFLPVVIGLHRQV